MKPNTSTLKVPGARIYYEKRGSGPTLLLIPGGPADAGAFTELAQRLADRYTVVSIDPRGNSRSTFDDAPQEMSLNTMGDDAAALIVALNDGPAYVFGTSGGAQIGLNLAARHPKQVRALVAHEPPCVMLLDDAKEMQAGMHELYALYLRQGAGAAMQKFMTTHGMARADQRSGPPPTADAMATFARIEKNFDYFFGHALFAISEYVPDVSTLRANKTRIVVGVGADTAGQTANRTGVALAAKLGVQPVTFPGDHVGYGPHAEAFARTLQLALSGT